MSKGKAKAEAQAVALPYEPTQRERETLEAFDAKSKALSPGIKVVSTGENSVTISTRHADNVTGYKLLADALGSGCIMFAQAFVGNLALATTSKGQIDEAGINNALDVVVALQPQDEAEAMLAAQMAMVHRAVMHSARLVRHSDTLQQIEAHDRCLNRLTRTYVAQMDTLKRYRSRGQKVIVEHVHVYEGGQAIVGDVHHGGGGPPSKAETTA